MTLSLLITVVLVLVVLGFLLWLVNEKVPMDPTVKTIITFVIVLGLVLWVLTATGIWDGHFGR